MVTHQPSSTSSSLSNALSLPAATSTQQQQQYVQPTDVYNHQPQLPLPGSPYSAAFPPTPATSTAQPPQSPQSSPMQEEFPVSSSVAPLKRKRGRPKGSKTKNRRIDGVLVPVQDITSSGSAPLHSGPVTSASVSRLRIMSAPIARTFPDEDEDDEELSDYHPEPADSAPLRGSAVPRAVPTSAVPSRPQVSIPPDADTSGLSHPASGSTATIENFYDFQWRVMSLCSVFYESASDLVRATDPSVLAQSFSLGSKADPLVLLQNAKQFCEVLLANPESLSRGPPPVPASLFPTPTPHSFNPPVAATSHAPAYPESLSLGRPSQPAYTAPISPSTSTSPSASYVPPTHNPGRPHTSASQQIPRTQLISAPVSPDRVATSASPIQSQPPILPTSGSPTSSFSVPPNVNLSHVGLFGQGQVASGSGFVPLVTPVSAPKGVAGSGHHGSWRQEEIDRLRSLAERSRTRTASGEIEWDWTIDQFGDSRSRHQILIKATSLGLKRTSTHPSRIRKRMSMQNAHDSSTDPSSSSFTQGHPPTSGAHQVDVIHETEMDLGPRDTSPRPQMPQSGPTMYVQPQPPLQQQQHQAPQHQHLPVTLSPAPSVSSTPTISQSEQQYQSQQPFGRSPRAPKPSHRRGPSSSTGSGSFVLTSPSMGSIGSSSQQTQPPSSYMQQQHPPQRSNSYSYPSTSQGVPPTQPSMSQQQQAGMQAARYTASPQFRSVSYSQPSSHTHSPSDQHQQHPQLALPRPTHPMPPPIGTMSRVAPYGQPPQQPLFSPPPQGSPSFPTHSPSQQPQRPPPPPGPFR